jgi:hypothetical protein
MIQLFPIDFPLRSQIVELRLGLTMCVNEPPCYSSDLIRR